MLPLAGSAYTHAQANQQQHMFPGYPPNLIPPPPPQFLTMAQLPPDPNATGQMSSMQPPSAGSTQNVANVSSSAFNLNAGFNPFDGSQPHAQPQMSLFMSKLNEIATQMIPDIETLARSALDGM